MQTEPRFDHFPRIFLKHAGTEYAWEAAGHLLGHLRYHLCPREVRAVAGNLRTTGFCKPEELPEAVRHCFRSFGLFAAEFLWGLSRPWQEVAERWHLEGEHHLRTLARSGRGWIIAGAHTGNWEQVALLARHVGRRIVVPSGVQFHPLATAAIQRAKARAGILAAPADSGFRRLLQALEEGLCVGLPLDGGSFKRGQRVRLGKAEVLMAQGAARLAAMAGVPVLTAFGTRLAFMSQRIRIGSPIPPPKRTAEAIAETLFELAARLSAHLAHAFSEWCIFRPLQRPHDEGTHRAESSPSSPVRSRETEAVPIW